MAEQGTWRLVSSTDPVRLTTEYWAGTLDTGGTALFAISCLHDERKIGIRIGEPRLKFLPYRENAVVGARLANSSPFTVDGLSLGRGEIVVVLDGFETMNRAIMNSSAASIGISVGGYQWLFPVDGFRALAPRVRAMCGEERPRAVPQSRGDPRQKPSVPPNAR
jgi:hypothetical protein